MKQSKSTWQRHERHVAAAVGGARTGNTGTVGADVVTDSYSIECKSWRRLPVKVVAALQQAERTATGGRVAVAVLHEVGRRHDDDLVVLRWRDFADLLIGDHEDDRDTARRVGAALEDATVDELAILTPDLLADGTDEQEALHAHIVGLWGE
ncbi:MAG TPA: hypothetical protein DCL15_11570 [Chloroflexi bacterium]|nr:hypothetical protein [Chloroflexota bacterium]